MMIAYCYRDGHVHMAHDQAPEGSVELFRGPQRDVMRLIEATTNKRLIEGLSSSTTVADDQQHLLLYLEEARNEANRLVTVNDLSRDILEADSEVA